MPDRALTLKKAPTADFEKIVQQGLKQAEVALEAAARGGKIVAPAREVMGGRVAVVQDPAGAVMALWEGPKSPS